MENNNNLHEQNGQGIKIYSYRWVVLTVYMLITAVIQLMWATFFSITSLASQFYGFTDAVKGENAISLLSIIFMVGMILLSVPSLAAFEKWGFKKAVGFGTTLAAVCGLIRGVFGDNYTVVLVITFGFAIAQPFILNAPGLVAGKWFPEKERATANGVGLLANYLGIAAGLLITPLLIGKGFSIKEVLIIYGIVGAVAAALFLVFAKEKPPTPPCAEEEAMRVNFKEGIKTAFKRRDFLLSIAMFFCLLGVFNTFFTMIEPLINSMTGGTVDATNAGLIGVIILISGIIGSFVLSIISDKDKKHRRLLYMIICNILGLVGIILFIVLGGFKGMIIAALIYGFFTVGSAPIVLTFAAEAAYPTSEGTSEGLLLFSGNVGGVIMLGAASLLGGNHLWVMIGIAGISLICILLMSIAKERKLIN